ncbi:MAG: family deacetylase [Dehalococcoidia bacterium]|nr:family deacetylase [Dehalococcoidia bacterium]
MGEQTPAKVMVIMAHPDDAEFSCGGTIAKWAALGSEITYVICTNGNKGSDDPEMTPERLAVIRQQEQRDAAKVLGVKDVIFLGYPDGGLEDTSEIRGEIVRQIRMHQPEIIVTMDPMRRYFQHRDHRVAGTLALDAAMPYSRSHLFYPEQIAQGLKPHKTFEAYISAAENPNLDVDIADTFDLKVDALLQHVSQMGGATKEELGGRLKDMSARFLGIEGENPHLVERFRRIVYRRREEESS